MVFLKFLVVIEPTLRLKGVGQPTDRMETEQTPTSQLLPPPPVIRYGSYDTTIDMKRRLGLAAEIRNGMDPWRDGLSFFVFIGKNRKIWFFPKFPYLRLVSKARVGLTPSDDDLAFYQVMVGNAYEVEWDKQGRVILPEKLLKHRSD